MGKPCVVSNLAHTLAYSLIGLQEMNLAYKYPIIFWNTANLIVDSGAEEEEEEEGEAKDETSSTNSKVNYGKIASAVGRMQKRGITVLPPSINKSKYTFTPDVEKNSIMYGLKGIVRIGDRIVNEIIQYRPFVNIKDFLDKVKINKLEMSILLKSGAFDEFGKRKDILLNYIQDISETKKTLNLRNANMLFQKGLLPDELDFERRVFNFNKYIRKTLDKANKRLTLDEISYPFFERHFSLDLLSIDENNNYTIHESTWKGIYDKYMNTVRQYIKTNLDELLEKVNEQAVKEMMNKYAEGNAAKWSMDSVSFYQDEHELDEVDLERYGIVNFFDLPNEPEVANSFRTKEGHLINMYKIYKIAGTVIDRDKNKSLITLLTKEGVVEVLAYGIMAHYDKQISEVGEDGKKHVVEKGWFTRGTKIIVQGMKRDKNTFVAKKYKRTPGHHFTLITDIKDGELILQEERIEIANE